jgi:hypothetical protein
MREFRPPHIRESLVLCLGQCDGEHIADALSQVYGETLRKQVVGFEARPGERF